MDVVEEAGRREGVKGDGDLVIKAMSATQNATYMKLGLPYSIIVTFWLCGPRVTPPRARKDISSSSESSRYCW